MSFVNNPAHMGNLFMFIVLGVFILVGLLLSLLLIISKIIQGDESVDWESRRKHQHDRQRYSDEVKMKRRGRPARSRKA